jgi:hypothetical protein
MVVMGIMVGTVHGLKFDLDESEGKRWESESLESSHSESVASKCANRYDCMSVSEVFE